MRAPTLIQLLCLRCLLGMSLGLFGSASIQAAGFRITDQSGSPVNGAVVSFEPLDQSPPATVPQLINVGQEGLRFAPHVSVIRTGDQVNFPNRDPVRHHIYSFSEARPLEIKLYSGLPAAPLDFPRPGVVVLGCNIHDWMLGFIVVLDTPWWQISDQQGRTTDPEIPAGRYRVRVWHSQLPTPAQSWEQELVFPLEQEQSAQLVLGDAPDLTPPDLGLGSR